ncbi:MAG: class I SAM-dependent RNA methyltransferase [Marmoricola sp.]
MEEHGAGELLELTAGKVAHGGHVVARAETGQVVFVRHALPGERVRVRVTEDKGSFLRADAVEVVEASPFRVEAPCPLAGPGRCGGCDFQHVELAEQRRLKAAVVREQLQRLAGRDLAVVCEPVPGDLEGLRWRTRMQYVPLPGGARGLRRHRSHEAIEVDDCLLAAPEARDVSAQGTVREEVLGRGFDVAADGFWQVHPGAATVLVETVLDQLGPQAGERALDLYAGVGLFSRFLAEAVGEQGAVVAVESDRTATDHARVNLSDHRQAVVVRDRVDRWIRRPSLRGQPLTEVDLVVLDPPRAGAKRAVVAPVAALRPRAISYVACDPAALARDVALFAEAGYSLTALRCLDLFPMTHHVECVALLERR